MTLTSTANPPSEDVKDMLVAGLGYVFGTDLFIASQPTSPNNCTLVSDTGGQGQEEYGLEKPNIQIMLRNNSYQSGYDLIRNIKYYLHDARNNETWNGTKYILIACRSDILYLGQDEKNRYQWSLNFQIFRSGI